MKRKILFISSRPIFPVMGGDQIRTAQQLKFLTQRYLVDVLYLYENDLSDRTKHYLPNVNEVYAFHVTKLQSYFYTLRFLLNTLPLQVNYYFSNKVCRFIRSHIHEYEFVFCNNIRTAEYVREIKDVKRYIDYVDAISMNYEKAKNITKGIKKLIFTIDYKRCLKYEQQVLRDFDCCAIISEIDKQYILEWQKKFM